MSKSINISYQITMCDKDYQEMQHELGTTTDSDIETFFRMIVQSSGGKSDDAMQIQNINVFVSDDNNLN